MQVNAKQYASVLYALTKDAPADEISGLVTRFLALLEKDNARHLAGSVLREYETLLVKKNESPEVTIKSPVALSQNMIETILSQMNINNGITVKQDVDTRMIGGVAIKQNNQLFDLSLKRRLARLSEAMR